MVYEKSRGGAGGVCYGNAVSHVVSVEENDKPSFK